MQQLQHVLRLLQQLQQLQQEARSQAASTATAATRGSLISAWSIATAATSAATRRCALLVRAHSTPSTSHFTTLDSDWTASLVFCDVCRLRGVKQGGGVTLKTQRQQFSNAMKVLCKYGPSDFNILALYCNLPSDATSLAHLAPSHHTHTHTACSQRLLFAYFLERYTLRQPPPTHTHSSDSAHTLAYASLHHLGHERAQALSVLSYADIC